MTRVVSSPDNILGGACWIAVDETVQDSRYFLASMG